MPGVPSQTRDNQGAGRGSFSGRGCSSSSVAKSVGRGGLILLGEDGDSEQEGEVEGVVGSSQLHLAASAESSEGLVEGGLEKQILQTQQGVFAVTTGRGSKKLAEKGGRFNGEKERRREGEEEESVEVVREKQRGGCLRALEMGQEGLVGLGDCLEERRSGCLNQLDQILGSGDERLGMVGGSEMSVGENSKGQRVFREGGRER